ncbi:MAG: ANTAR domain-containing protein [Acidimicrobiales bacterium]
MDEDQGPCLSVLTGRSSEYANDLASDVRWPRFGSQAVLAGVRSLFAVAVGDGATPASLNLYAGIPDAFGPIDRGQAAIFAIHARLAFAERRQHSHEASTEAQLRVALTTRDVIGQAQGILMERDHISARQAFDVLRQASQHLNIKLREVAQTLVDTGEDPETGPSGR